MHAGGLDLDQHFTASGSLTLNACKP